MPSMARVAARNAQFRQEIPHSNALDLLGERHILWPGLGKRMHEAFTAAGGKAEFRMLPPFGSDGHFLIDAAEAIPIWSPLVSRFLDQHQ